MTDDYGWIDDPAAIDTVVALQGIRVGDEVRLQNSGTYGVVRAGPDGAVGVVSSVEDIWDSFYPNAVARVQFNGPTSFPYFLQRRHIGAWRPRRG